MTGAGPTAPPPWLVTDGHWGAPPLSSLSPQVAQAWSRAARYHPTLAPGSPVGLLELEPSEKKTRF